jgi:UDP-N-acetylmuramoyl-L-alanyl-D-glutamate--2,6-diaminopimelate ligase
MQYVILQHILKGLKVKGIYGTENVSISTICFNSNDAIKNSLFVATRGTQFDGHIYIESAIKNGAIAIVCEKTPEQLSTGVTYVQVNDSGAALGMICSNYFDDPSSKLKLIGVTGTNGKSTIATLLYHLFRNLGYKAGLISTIRYCINDKYLPATHTTPDSFAINKLLSEMVAEKCEYCFMEVSSHAVVQKRIAGLNFKGGIFTNITHDHLDYHKTFKNYIEAKKSFFNKLSSDAFALTNIDDRNGEVMIQNTKAKKYTYSMRQMADFKSRMIENTLDGMHIEIAGKELWSELAGEFNTYNITAIYATAVLLEQEQNQVLTILSGLQAPEGRFESIKDEKNVVAIIDYAHTPDALKNVLSTINQIRQGKGNLICIVGAGGDRDKTKRPEMAKIAAAMSQKVIFTSDNPRSENPETIIDDMMTGIEITDRKKVLKIINREEAIKTAYALARAGDILLIAGKGHEKYQEIKGVKTPFDDKKIIKELMNL